MLSVPVKILKCEMDIEASVILPEGKVRFSKTTSQTGMKRMKLILFTCTIKILCEIFFSFYQDL